MSGEAPSQPPRIEVLGPVGAGRKSLVRLLDVASAGESSLPFEIVEELSSEPAAVLLACQPTVKGKVARDDLEPLAKQLNRLSAERGRSCAVGAVPVFLVLTKCDLLAQPADTLGDWLERLEASKHEAAQALQPLLAPSEPGGFGALRLHLWATAVRRPALAGGPPGTQEPFGVRELLTQVQHAVHDYARRSRKQSRRLNTLVASTAGLIGVLLLCLTVVLAFRSTNRDGNTIPPASEPWPAGDLLVQGQSAAADARRLLSFAGFVSADGRTTDWPRWHRDAQEAIEHLGSLRAQLAAERIGAMLTGELLDLQRALALVSQRAELFGLAGEVKGRPAALHFAAEPIPFGELRAEMVARLMQIQQSYPQFEVQQLPREIPLGIARELQDAARVNYEKLLAPVQQEIRARLERLGEGKETVQAWRELADGWLAGPAEADLFDWRQLAVILQRLEGRENPSDPLTELTGFLQRTEFSLPLERVLLQLPTRLVLEDATIDGLRPTEAPLILTLRDSKGTVTTVNLLPLGGTQAVPGVPTGHIYEAARRNPLTRGRLVFRPGEQLAARVKLVDQSGRSYELAWPTADSPSAVFTFAALTQAPRLLANEQTSATEAPIAFGVRLLFSEPSAFALPDLTPR